MSDNRNRPKLRTTVSTRTLEWLGSQSLPSGRVVDELVAGASGVEAVDEENSGGFYRRIWSLSRIVPVGSELGTRTDVVLYADEDEATRALARLSEEGNVTFLTHVVKVPWANVEEREHG